MSPEKGIVGRLSSLRKNISEDFTQELMSNPKFAEMIGSAVERALNAKRTVDKNLQFFFRTINLPSRDDYNSLLSKLDQMNNSVSDLESRIDDLIATSERLTVPKSSAKKKKKKS